MARSDSRISCALGCGQSVGFVRFSLLDCFWCRLFEMHEFIFEMHEFSFSMLDVGARRAEGRAEGGLQRAYKLTS